MPGTEDAKTLRLAFSGGHGIVGKVDEKIPCKVRAVADSTTGYEHRKEIRLIKYVNANKTEN